MVEQGSMLYSAVIQPRPLLKRKGGTLSSMEAVQIILVLPDSMKTEPAAYPPKGRVTLMGRI